MPVNGGLAASLKQPHARTAGILQQALNLGRAPRHITIMLRERRHRRDCHQLLEILNDPWHDDLDCTTHIIHEAQPTREARTASGRSRYTPIPPTERALFLRKIRSSTCENRAAIAKLSATITIIRIHGSGDVVSLEPMA